MAPLTDVAALDAHMLNNSYVEGVAPTQKDMSVFKAISPPTAAHPHAQRWYEHIKSFSAAKIASLPGAAETLTAATKELSVSDAPKAAKEEKAPKEKKEKAPKEKKEKPAKEEKPKEEKKEPSAEEVAKQKAKDAEKLKAKIIKEGGKKGVEIEGASDMGGLDFFCTTMELPEGDLDFLELSMVAMNAQPDPEAEDRKGCSGHVGKMIFSAGVEQLAIVGYVPGKEHNKSAEKVELAKWMDAVCKATDGKIVKKPATADSPNGGTFATAVVKSDPGKGKFAIKDKDSAMAAAFNFLRSVGAFPEDDGDDSDDMVFGDDDNLDDYE
jgi:hypothetical protein